MKTLKFTIIILIYYIIAVISTAHEVHAQAYNWSQVIFNGQNGTDGEIYSSVYYNGNIVIAGKFNHACGVNTLNIAMWHDSVWAPLGQGIGPSNGDTIYSLTVYNSKLYAGGRFTTAGGVTSHNIAQWDGVSWSALGSGTDSAVYALCVFNGELAVGGFFTHAGGLPNTNAIAGFNGTSWSSFGGGFNQGDEVYAITVDNVHNLLISAGLITQAGGNIASWNGSSWSPMSTSTNGIIFTVAMHNNNLFAGGEFTIIGGSANNHIAGWNGSTWFSLNGGVSDNVNAIISFSGKLIAGGSFKYANGSSLYVDRISQYDGFSWSRMITGVNSDVQGLYVFPVGQDTILYALGDFTTAGGKYANRLAEWYNQPTSIVSGLVTYSDNNQPVLNGTAKILRRDVNTQEVIVTDSTPVTNGVYALPRVPRDSTDRVIIFPNDDNDFVPTYFPSAIDWRNASPLNPFNNLVNINVSVYRITPGSNGPNVSGYVHLNLVPPLLQPGNFPYNSDAIIYFKQGNVFKKFAVSNTTEHFTAMNVSPGTYEVKVYRLGYKSDSQSVTVNNVNIDSLNFNLDTSTVIGIRNLSSVAPSGFMLEQNYPNPFNPATKIKFDLPKSNFTLSEAKGLSVKLIIYDILGREVTTLVNQQLKPGSYEVTWNASNYSSGIYFYTLISQDYTETKKLILLK